MAQYLDKATIERNGSTVVLTFEDTFAEETIRDAKDSVAAIAKDVYGEPMKIETRVAAAVQETGRRAEDKPSALNSDPVLSAFRKHLGGELVKETKR